MAVPFSRSMRSLEADSFRPSVWAIFATITLIVAWCLWFGLARVPLYEVSTTGRLQAESATHEVDAPTAGRVISVHMALGQEVAVGDALVVLDTERETSRVAEGDARLEGLNARLAALAAARNAEILAAANQLQADRNAADAADARHRQAVSALRVAEAAAQRTGELNEQGLASEADLERDRGEAEQQQAAVSASKSELDRTQSQQQQNENAHQARLADWDRQIAALEAESNEIRAAGLRLDHDVSDRVIRATVAGRLGEVNELRPGSVVSSGENIAHIIPSGGLIIVAKFPATSSIGRLKAGQAAKMRLDAFPWIHHGQVDAEVFRVGTENSDGNIRVELRVGEVPAGLILEHGLTGSVAVVVERITPWNLLLRAVGKRLSAVR